MIAINLCPASMRNAPRWRVPPPIACVMCESPIADVGKLSRDGRCSACRNVHLMKGGTVHPTLPFFVDEAAMDFVDAHPGGATLEEVASAMGITRERVRQILARAIRNLRLRCKAAGISEADVLEMLAGKSDGPVLPAVVGD